MTGDPNYGAFTTETGCKMSVIPTAGFPAAVDLVLRVDHGEVGHVGEGDVITGSFTTGFVRLNEDDRASLIRLLGGTS